MGAPLHGDPRPGSPTNHQPTVRRNLREWKGPFVSDMDRDDEKVAKADVSDCGKWVVRKIQFLRNARFVWNQKFLNRTTFSCSYLVSSKHSRLHKFLQHSFVSRIHGCLLHFSTSWLCSRRRLYRKILVKTFESFLWTSVFSWLFRTIFFVSIFYACGQILLAFSSIAPSESSHHPYLDLLGLLIVGLGTGGIKPCVSAFGGDQFPAHYTRMISIFFSVFYFSINAGSLISMYITPYLRSLFLERSFVNVAFQQCRASETILATRWLSEFLLFWWLSPHVSEQSFFHPSSYSSGVHGWKLLVQKGSPERERHIPGHLHYRCMSCFYIVIHHPFQCLRSLLHSRFFSALSATKPLLRLRFLVPTGWNTVSRDTTVPDLLPASTSMGTAPNASTLKMWNVSFESSSWWLRFRCSGHYTISRDPRGSFRQSEWTVE